MTVLIFQVTFSLLGDTQDVYKNVCTQVVYMCVCMCFCVILFVTFNFSFCIYYNNKGLICAYIIVVTGALYGDQAIIIPDDSHVINANRLKSS